MASSTIAQAVSFNISRHSQLTASLAEVEHVPAAIIQQKAKMADLRRQLEETEERIGILFSKTHSARKAAEASTTEPRKFTFFNKKKAPEKPRSQDYKAAYLSALQEEMAERAQETYLQESLKVAENVLLDLSGKAAEYAQLKAELRKVYNSIFDGPTIGFPDEDRLEHQLKAAKAACDRVEAALQVDAQVVEALDQALKTSNDCKARLEDSSYWATAAVFASDRPPDANEFLALHEAKALIKKIDGFMQKARNGSPNVAEVKMLKIGDDLFVPNDNKLHVKVKSVIAEAERVHSAIQVERNTAHARLSVSKAVADEALQGYEACQDELDTTRGKIFTEIATRLQQNPEEFNIAESELTEMPPPSYNRASTSSSILSPRSSQSNMRGKSPSSRSLPHLSHTSFVSQPQPDFLNTPVSALDSPSFESSLPRRSRSHSIVRGPRAPRPLPRPPIQSPS